MADDPWAAFNPTPIGNAVPVPTSVPAAPDAAPAPLTVHPDGSRPADPWAAFNPTPIGQAADAPTPAPSPSDAAPSSAAGTGALSNTGDDGWLSGAAKGAATGAIEGVGHILGQVGDTRNFARYLAALAASPFDSRSTADIYADMQQKDAADDKSAIIPTPASVFGDSSRYTDPVFAKTGQYTPTTEVGKMAQAGVAAATGAIGPGSGAAALTRTAEGSIVPTAARTIADTVIKQGVGNAAAGAGQQLVTDETGSPLAGILTGLAVPAAVHGASNALGSVGDQFHTASGSEARVGASILANAHDPKAVTSALAGSGPVDPTLGLKLTTPEFTQDPGLLNAQRALKTKGPEGSAPYTDLENFNTGQMRNAVSAAAPEAAAADPMAPSQYLENYNKRLDDAANQAVEILQQRARDAGTGALGDASNPEDQGSAIRQQLQSVMDAKHDVRAEAYRVVDPENRLVADTSGVAEAAQKVTDNLTPFDSQSDAEKRLFDLARGVSDATPYNHMVAFDRTLNDVLPTETPTGRFRLAQLKDAVIDTLHGTADSAAATDPAVNDRLSQHWGSQPDNALGGAERAGNQSGEALPGAQTSGDTGGLGTAGGSQQRPGPTPGNPADASGGQGVRSAGPRPAGPERFDNIPVNDDTAVTRRPVAPGVPKPQDLHSFIRSLGGIQDRNGDVASMGLNNLVAKPGQGLGADAVRQVAAEAGYLGADTNHAMAHTDVNDLYNAMGHDNPIYSVRDADAAHAWDSHREMMEQYNRVSGPTSKSATPPKPPISAYNAEDAYPGGMAPAANANTRLIPNADAAAGSRIAAAKASHIDYLNYKQGQVGSVLDTNGYKGQYNVTNASVPGRAVKPGPTGYEQAKEFISKSQNNPHVINAMKETVLDPLRAKAQAQHDGSVTGDALTKWKQQYGGTLRAIDEVEPGFSKKFDNAAQVSNDLIRANQIRIQAVKEFQQSAAGKFLGKTNPIEAQSEMMSILRDARNGPTRMASLVKKLRQDPTGNAMAGAQKLAIDALSQEMSNAAQAGTSGERVLSSAKTFKLSNNSEAALKTLFPNGRVPNTLKAVSRAMDVFDSEHTAGRLKSTSQTSKDLGNQLGPKTSMLSHLMGASGGHKEDLGGLIGLAIGEQLAHGGIESAALGAGPLIGKALVRNRIAKGVAADQVLYGQAMRDPNVARAAIAAAQKKPGAGNWLSAAIRKSLVTSPIRMRNYY